MFPQFGAPAGFLLSGCFFLLLSHTLTDAQFLDFGWRLPFIASSLLVFVGLYVRLKITETRVFLEAVDQRKPVEVPLLNVVRDHAPALVLGTLMALANFVLYYLLTVFCLSWGTSKLGFTREHFLFIQMIGILFFGLGIPGAAVLADRHGRRVTQIWISLAIGLFGLAFGRLFQAGLPGVITTMVVGFSLMGLTYGALGTLLSELYPTTVRYTGSSLSFNLAGIFGASLTPFFATELAVRWGLPAVGYYLCAAAVLTLVALVISRETRDGDYAARA
jgi:MFS family permease